MSAVGHDLAPADTSDIGDVGDIEEAFVAHWSLFGRWPGAHLVDENGVLRFETPLRKLPYNGIVRAAIDECADQVVAGVIDRRAGFARRCTLTFYATAPLWSTTH